MCGYYLTISTYFINNRAGSVMYYSQDKQELENLAKKEGAKKEKSPF